MGKNIEEVDDDSTDPNERVHILYPFLKQSYFKSASKSIQKFHSFLSAILDPHPIYSIIIFVIFIIQMFTVSLIGTNSKVWDKNSLSGQTEFVLSISLLIVPRTQNKDIYGIICIVYIAIILFLFFSHITITLYFSKKFHVSKNIIKIYSFILQCYGYVTHPIALSCVLVIFTTGQVSVFAKSSAIACSIVLLITLFFNSINDTTAFFIYPGPIPVLRGGTRMISFYSIQIQIVLTNLFTHVNYIHQIVFIIICIALSIANFTLISLYGILLKKEIDSAFFAATIACVVSYITAGTFTMLDIKAPDYTIFIFFIVGIISMFSYRIYAYKRARKILEELDFLQDNPDEINKLSTNSIINLATRGFVEMHPFCTSYDIFKLSTNLRPDDINLHLVYAKFLSINPKSLESLQNILTLIHSSDYHGINIKMIEAQIRIIIMRRDLSLSPALEQKLNSMKEISAITKTRLRFAWETVLMGNKAETVPLLMMAIKSINEAMGWFSNLESYYGSNRYALQAQAQYCQEILGDQMLYEAIKQKIKLLTALKFVRNDQVANYMECIVPGILQNLHIQDNSAGNVPTPNHSADINEMFNGDDQNVPQNAKEAIEKLKFRSVTFSRAYFITLTLISVLIPCFIYPFGTQGLTVDVSRIVEFRANTNDAIKAFEEACAIAEMFVIGTQYHISAINSGELLKIQEKTIEHLFFKLENVENLRQYHYTDASIKKAKEILFEKKTPLRYYYEWDKYEDTNISIQSMTLKIAFDCLRIANDPKTFIHSSELATVITSRRNITDALLNAGDCFTLYSDARINTIQALAIIVVVVIIAVFLIFWIFGIHTSWKMMKKDRENAFFCLHALPRSVLKQMIAKMSEDKDEEKYTNDEMADKKEEDALCSLGSYTDSSEGSNDWVLPLINLFLALVICVIYLGCNGYVMTTIREYSKVIKTQESSAYSYISTERTLIYITNAAANPDSDVIYHDTFSNYSLSREFYNDMEIAMNSFETLFYGTEESNTIPLALSDPTPHNEVRCYNVKYACVDSCDVIYIFTHEIHILQHSKDLLGNLNLYDERLWRQWETYFRVYKSEVFNVIDDYLYNLAQSIINFDSSIYFIILIIPIILIILLVVLMIITINKFAADLKVGLKLLLHAPPEVVMQSRYIVGFLMNDTKSLTTTTLEIDDSCAQKIIEQLHCCVVGWDDDNNITIKNSLFDETFGELPDEILNMTPGDAVTFESDDQTYTVEVIRRDKHNLAVIYNLTDSIELEKKFEEETERTKQIFEIVRPPRAKEVNTSDMASLLCICVQAEQEKMFSSISLILDTLFTYRKMFPKVDNIQLLSDHIYVSSGVVLETSAQDSAISLIQFALAVLEYCEQNLDQSVNIKMGAVGKCSLTGIAIGIQFNISGQMINVSRILADEGESYAIIVDQNIYELIYSTDIQTSQNKVINLPKFGEINTFIVRN